VDKIWLKGRIMEKIAILIPTILRDDILMETLNSILDVYQENWIILIADQNNIEDYSLEKQIFYRTACSEAHHFNPSKDRIQVVPLPFNCGLSYSRNKLVEKAKELGINYCLISADSIKFTESMKKVNGFIEILQKYPIDLIGLNLLGRNIGWEAKLDLKDSFILDFIDKTEDKTIHSCDIVRNFFLASTESLLKTQWDKNLILGEHEDFFWRYKQGAFKVGWTHLCSGEYIGKKEGEYLKLRTKNMKIGKERLKEKYPQLKKWVTYINLDRAKEQAN
jgi:glycosyltransferase involved in cell wall biosynthesis